jgi:hypothetical protein
MEGRLTRLECVRRNGLDELTFGADTGVAQDYDILAASGSRTGCWASGPGC